MAFDITSYIMGKKSGGGSGGGDFSVAKVTISLKNTRNVQGGDITFYFPNVQNDGIKLNGIVYNSADQGKLTTETFDIVLYKGMYKVAKIIPTNIQLAGFPESTGGCALSQDETGFEITGDGTITIPVLANS